MTCCLSNAEESLVKIAENKNGVSDAKLTSLEVTWHEFTLVLKNPQIGNKDGSYFIRCSGSKRNNQDTDDTASILILDGDSSLTCAGETIPGAPHPKRVFAVLRKLGITHCIYSSHSNGCNKANENTDYDPDFHKYRVIIPCLYTRDQLANLLEYIFSELHNSGVMLVNVPENKTWSQPWYYPRVPDKNAKELFEFYSHEGKAIDVDQVCGNWEQISPAKEPEVIARKNFNLLEGQVDVIDAFNKQNTCEDVLVRNGYTKKGNRFLRPGSETGAAAVQYCQNCKDGVDRVYSHGSDILNDGKAHDAFDCHLKLECNNEMKAALNWNPELTKQNQRAFIEEREKANITDFDPNTIYKKGNEEIIPMPMLIQDFPTEILRKTHKFYQRSSTKATHHLSMLGVIGLASVLANRIFISDQDNMTPLYLCGIGISGRGKNNPKEVTCRILNESNLFALIGSGTFTSSSALRNMLVQYPARIMVIDEFGDKLSEALNARNGLMAGGFSALKDLFSDCNGVYLKQVMADTGRAPKNAEKDIIKPCLSMLAISTPEQFHDALDQKSLEGGFINRLIIVDSTDDELIRNYGKKPQIPKWLEKHMKKFYDLRNRGNIDFGEGSVTFNDIAHEAFESEPDLIEMPFAKEAAKRLVEIDYLIEENAGDDELLANLTVRWREQVMRMGLALAVYDNPKRKDIPLEIVEWCWEFIKYHGDCFINKHRDKPESEFERNCNAVLKAIRNCGQNGMTRKQLGQVKRFKSLGARDRSEITKVLIDDGSIKMFETKGSHKGGPKTTVFYAIGG